MTDRQKILIAINTFEKIKEIAQYNNKVQIKSLCDLGLNYLKDDKGLDKKIRATV